MKVVPENMIVFRPRELYVTEMGPVPDPVAGLAPTPKFQLPEVVAVNITSEKVHPVFSTVINGGFPGTLVIPN